MKFPHLLPLRLLRARIGASTLEYGLLATLIGGLTVFATINLSTRMALGYHETTAALENVQRIMEDSTAFVHFRPRPQTASGTGDDPEAPTYQQDSLDRITTCEPYRTFRYGFQEQQVDLQIPVRGNVIGSYFKVAIDKKNPDAAYVQKIEALGQSDEVFLLGIEYDGVHEWFQNFNRVSVFTLDGKMVITRALVKIYAEDDIHQGDDYLISENKDFIIDINGLDDRDDYTYDRDNQAGENDVGNGDTRLDFIDIGCLVYEDGTTRNIEVEPTSEEPATDPSEPDDSVEDIEWGTGQN